MPIFEYNCVECGETFEKLIQLSKIKVEKIACPNCGSVKTRKKLSTFVARTTGGSSTVSAGASDCATGGT